MRQDERLNANNDGHNTFKTHTQQQAINASMEGNGLFLVAKNSMGNNSSVLSERHQQPEYNIHSFFNRLGHYNVLDILSTDKKMATIVIKISFIIANLMGVSLWAYWLMIDMDGIKIFLTTVGTMLYGGMKLYEKYLDVKTKKRDNKMSEDKFNNLNKTNHE